jgi:RND family efflux transporter MFP subunit
MTRRTMKKMLSLPVSFARSFSASGATAFCLVLGAAGLALATASVAQDAAKTGAAPKASLTITTAKPAQSALPLRLAANGNIAAWQEASVGSESGGLKLQEVRVNVGDVVRRDQVLAVFAAESVQADLGMARANLAEAQALSLDAAGNAERARSLQTSGALSTQQISQYTTADLTARARVQSAQAALTQQELRRKHTEVLAPDSGIISARSATVGSVPGAGVELFRLIRQGRLEWRAEVTSAELGRLKIGTPVQVLSASGASVAGTVRMVAPTVDPQSRAALVYVDLQSHLVGAKPPSGGSAARAAASVGALLPGMFARGEFALGSSSALTVPQQAVVVRDGFNYVFTIGPGNKVAQQKIETGRRVGERVEILKGLGADTPIAVAGAGFLNDGDTVRIAPAAAATPAPAAPAAAK